MTGPPATLARPSGGWLLVDIAEPRPQSDMNDPLLFENLNLWDVPDNAVIDGKVLISVPGGDTWHRPVRLVEVPRG